MNIEIERKFLVLNDSWKEYSHYNYLIQQAYISHNVRVRLTQNNDSLSPDFRGYITIKIEESPMVRTEIEPEIPYNDALNLFNLHPDTQIEKVRHILVYKKKKWEIDVFKGKYEGLVLAEIELKSTDEKIVLPKWVGEEVTNDYTYTNSYMALHSHDSNS